MALNLITEALLLKLLPNPKDVETEIPQKDTVEKTPTNRETTISDPRERISNPKETKGLQEEEGVADVNSRYSFFRAYLLE